MFNEFWIFLNCSSDNGVREAKRGASNLRFEWSIPRIKRGISYTRSRGTR